MVLGVPPPRGMRPIVVSMVFPRWTAAAEAPDPGYGEINDASSTSCHEEGQK